MKVRIKSGECPNYLTADRVYKVSDSGIEDYLFFIKCDKSETRLIYLEDCDHLKGGSWEIVDE